MFFPNLKSSYWLGFEFQERRLFELSDASSETGPELRYQLGRFIIDRNTAECNL